MFSQVLPRCENADSACTVAARREWSAHAIASTDSSGTGLSRLGCAGPTITRFLRAIGLIRRHPSCSWAATCGPTAIFAIATPPARSSGCGLGTSPSEELSGGRQRYSCGRASRLRGQSTYIFLPTSRIGLKTSRQPRTLIDCPPGIQFGCRVGTSNNVRRGAASQ